MPYLVCFVEILAQPRVQGHRWVNDGLSTHGAHGSEYRRSALGVGNGEEMVRTKMFSMRSCMAPDLIRLGDFHCIKPSAAAMEVQLGCCEQLKRVENRGSQLFIRVHRT